jgi:hypothetical protein
LAVTSALSGVQNLKYSKGLLRSSKLTFMRGLPVNEKYGHSAPDFRYAMLHATVAINIFFFIRAYTLVSAGNVHNV